MVIQYSLTRFSTHQNKGQNVMGTVADVQQGVSNLVDAVARARDNSAQSLSERAKAATVISRVFVDNNVAGEEIMLPLVGTLTQIYIAYLVTALGLESFVADGLSVRHLTQMVATEGLLDARDLIGRHFGNLKSSSEGLGDKIEEEWNKPNPRDRRDDRDLDAAAVRAFGRSGLMDLDKAEQHLIAGRLVEVSINTARGGTVPLRIYTQLVPRIVAPEVAGAFIGLSLDGSLSRRWRKVRNGEIALFRDFILNVDRIKEHRNLLKKDTTGDLAEMMARSQNSLMKYWMSLSGIRPNFNTASGVLIISKEELKHQMDEAGYRKFDRKAKGRFFHESFMMMLAVVDRQYNTVELYTHGIDGRGEYSYSEIEKVGSAKKGGLDLKDVMSVFSRGNMVSHL
jgi:hypothetical protein